MGCGDGLAQSVRQPQDSPPLSVFAVLLLDLPWWWIILLPLLFTALQLLLSQALYRLNIRKRPH